MAALLVTAVILLALSSSSAANCHSVSGESYRPKDPWWHPGADSQVSTHSGITTGPVVCADIYTALLQVQ